LLRVPDENPVQLNDGWFEFILDGSGLMTGRLLIMQFVVVLLCYGHVAVHKWQDKFLVQLLLDQEWIQCGSHNMALSISD